MKFLLKSALILLLLTAAAVVWNSLHQPDPPAPAAALPPAPLDEAAAAQRLAAAIRIPTVSYGEPERNDARAFDALADLLVRSFPRVHTTLTRERVGSSLLYTWRGSDAGAQPILLLAHLDVVPVDPDSAVRWTHPPFAGAIADGYVWGRGALDDKNNALALLESAEQLLAQGFVPRQTLYFAFGHDEEIGGREGAAKIAALLKSRGVHASFVLDEGGVISQGVVPGVGAPVASIMAAEKGYVSFRLTVHAAGGHSSIPPNETAIGILARAVSRVQNRRLPGRVAPPVSDMLTRLAPAMPLSSRVAIANRWLFGPLLVAQMSRTPVGNALVRTTTAPTIFHGGVKDNVLPTEAYAVINYRLLPDDSIADVEHHLRLAVADDRVQLRREGGFDSEASPASDTHGATFALLERTVNQVFPEALVSTGLVVGATDTRHYAGLYDNRYNFSPNLYTPQDLPRVHGVDERIGVADYANMIRWYMRLLQNAQAP